MAFPQSRLDTQLHFQFDGVNWTDATQYLYAREDGGVTITRGRSDWGTEVDPGICSFLLDNRDGRFSPRNPLGPYYGQIGRNTPCRISVNQGATYLDLPGGTTRMTTPDGAAVDITGDIDVRVDYYLNEWVSTPAGPIELCGKWRAGTNDRSWMLVMNNGLLSFYTSPDGIAEPQHVSTSTVTPDATGRLAVRATLDVDNGAAGHTVTFYTAKTIAGPWLQLGNPVVTAGTTSLFNSSQSVDVGAVGVNGFPDPVGKVYGFELRNGINGTVVANPDFTIQTAGATSFADAAGRTWSTFGGATLSNRKIRFLGEVPEWPLNQDVTGRDIYLEIEASGRLRRLKANDQPLHSTLRRRIPTFAPLAYWPLEDGDTSTTGAAVTANTRPMKITTVTWAADDTLPASDPMPQLAVSSAAPCDLGGAVPPPATTPTQWAVSFLFRMNTTHTTIRTYMSVKSSGTVRQWFLQWSSTGINIIGQDVDGLNVFTQAIGTSTNLFNQWIRAEFQVSQSGGNVAWHIGFIPVGGASTAFDSTFAGTVGRPTGVSSPPAGYSTDLDGLSLGHISVWTDNSDATDAYDNSDTAWSGETAAARLTRLASEEGVALNLRADPTGTYTVGPQRPNQLFSLLQDAADVDGGILMENRERLGLLYRDRVGMMNQTPRATLVYNRIQAPLTPADDDQATKNIVTVTRTLGSSYTASLDSGRMSQLEFPNGVGPYPDDVELNLETDDQVGDQAGWRLLQGTVDEPRYPVVNVWLQRSTSLLDQVLAIDSGDRIKITGPATRYQYDDIDMIVQGYTEFISQFRWEFQFNTTPASPWDVAWVSTETTALATDRFSWADTDGCVLGEPLTNTETDFDLLTGPNSPVWTSRPSDSPYLLSVAGETVRVDAPGNFVNVNPFFDSNVTGWTTDACTIAFSTAFVHPHPQALGSMLITPNGVAATGGALSTTTAVGTVNVGGLYACSGWVYSPGGHSDLRITIDWYTSGGALISSSIGSANVIPAGIWTYIEQTSLVAPATADRLQVKARYGGTPAASAVFYTWAVRAHQYKASTVYDDFGRTLTDTWGTADSKQTWTNTSTAADYDVLTGFGRHTNPATSASHHSVIAAPNADCDIYVNIATAALSTGSSQFAGALLRYIDVDNLYEARVDFPTSAAIGLSIRKRVATVETQLGSASTLLTHTAGHYYRVRFQISGTTLRAKIWDVADIESTAWDITVTDASLSAAGSIGMKTVRNAGNTNANAITQFQRFDLLNPQTFICTRSVNGVVKAQSAGAAIALRYPAITPL